MLYIYIIKLFKKLKTNTMQLQEAQKLKTLKAHGYKPHSMINNQQQALRVILEVLSNTKVSQEDYDDLKLMIQEAMTIKGWMIPF